MSAFTTFIKSEISRKWTDEQLQSLSDKDRRTLGSYNPSISTLKHELAEKVKAIGFSPADGIRALELCRASAATQLHKMQPEEYIAQKGGHVSYGPDTVTVYLRNGETKMASNSPIPGEFEQVDVHDNIDAVTAIAASSVVLRQGEWQAVSSEAWSKVYAVEVNAAHITAIGRQVANALNHCGEWQSMVTSIRNGMTGISSLRFIRRTLDKLPDIQWDYLNTSIVVSLLGAFSLRTQGKKRQWVQVLSDDDSPLVPESVYTKLKVTPGHKELFADRFPGVFKYNGFKACQYTPRINYMEDDGSIATLREAHSRLMEFAGGSDTCVSLLASMKGYSSMMTEQARRIHFFLSATLAAWQKGNIVDIRLDSVGDFVPLYSSLDAQLSAIRRTKPDLFKRLLQIEEAQVQANGSVIEWYKFMMPSRNSEINASELRSKIIVAHRSGAVAVFYFNRTLPMKSVTTSGPVDYDTESYSLFPEEMSEQYIGRMSIYGSFFFQKDPEVVKAQVKRSTTVSSKFCPNVFAFGSAREARGIVSSFDKLSLIGYGPSKKDGVWDLTQQSYVEEPLTLHSNIRSWYSYVHTSINWHYSTLWRPVVRYSPITNLMTMAKGKVQLSLQFINAENGEIFDTRVFPKKRENYKVVQDDFEAVDDEQGEVDTDEEVDGDTASSAGPEVEDSFEEDDFVLEKKKKKAVIPTIVSPTSTASYVQEGQQEKVKRVASPNPFAVELDN